MDKQYRVETAQDPQHVIQVLEEKLYEHNSGRIDKRDGGHFARVVRGDKGTIIAGIAGWTWAGACEEEHARSPNAVGAWSGAHLALRQAEGSCGRDPGIPAGR